MKPIVTTLICLFIGSQSLKAQEQNKVQIAILFDTSGSMDGLIEQAKTVIWQIVNAAGKLKNGTTNPKLEIAIYDYGNSTITNSDYVRLHCNLISNLDSISGILFGLTTNGGDEYCGSVIKHSISELNWSKNPNDIRIVYIAGNEPFNQGSDNYVDVLKNAATQNLIVNTIYCGPHEQGVREFWYDASLITQGNYFNIDANEDAMVIATPFDSLINVENKALNSTYFSFNEDSKFPMKQAMEDQNAESKGAGNLAERAISKAGKNYDNSESDLIDAYAKDAHFLDSLKDEQLPENMRNKSKEEKEVLIKELQQKREETRKEINELAKKRSDYIAAEKAKRISESGKQDLGSSVIESMNKHAQTKGYTVEK